MGIFFLVCAIVGGVILICQFCLTLLGMGGGHDLALDHHIDFGGHHGDVHTDQGSTWFFNVVSFRSMVAALTFFGLGGSATLASPTFAPLALPAGLAAGAVAMVIVAWLMSLLHTLQADGTVQITRSVGAMGTVYLTIPGDKQGTGKVTVKVQNRTMEYKAVTKAKEQIVTGTPVMVVGIEGPDMVEVGRMPE